MSYFTRKTLTKIKLLVFLIALALIFLASCEGKNAANAPKEMSLKDLPASALPEQPLELPTGSIPEAIAQNREGISHYKMGHYKTALKHFRKAEQIAHQSGEIHFNEGLSLKFMGDIGSSIEHFKQAKQNAKGNVKILESDILKETLNDKPLDGLE
jgi:tetratricopeptide (TPR) repeat protein